MVELQCAHRGTLNLFCIFFGCEEQESQACKSVFPPVNSLPSFYAILTSCSLSDAIGVVFEQVIIGLLLLRIIIITYWAYKNST